MPAAPPCTPPPPRLASVRSGCALLFAGSTLGCSAAPGGPVSLLFMGDSDIENWDTAAYPDAANVGVGGAVCQDVLESLPSTLEAHPPSRVVLVCGENDLWEQGVAATFADFSDVVAGIHEAGATVVTLGTKPEPATTQLHAEYRQYDARIRAHAASLASEGEAPLVMVDVYPGFEALGNPDRLYDRDGLHLSDEGYALWDDWLAAALDQPGCILWESGVCVQDAAE